MDKPKIVPKSYQLANGKYNPKAILSFISGPKTTERPLSWNKQFITKEEADKYAILQAQKYIEKNFG